MSSRLENLLQDLLRDSWIKATNVKGSFVGLRGSTAGTSAAGRHDAIAAGRGDGGRDGTRVLRDTERRRHVRAVEGLLTGRNASRWGVWQRGCGGVHVGHACDV